MAGIAGVTVDVRMIPPLPISIGVCRCRVGDIGADHPRPALRSIALASSRVPQWGTQEWTRRPGYREWVRRVINGSVRIIKRSF